MATTKRKKGTGTILSIRDKYRAELSFTHPLTSKRVVLRGDLRTRKKDAEIDLKELQEQKEVILNSRSTDMESTTVEDYYRKVFLPYKKETQKGQSYRRFESTVATHILPYLGMKLLLDLSSEDIRQRINEMSETASYSGTTKLYDAFNSMFTFAEENNDIPQGRNPMAKVPRPREDRFEKTEQEWLRPDEVKRFAKAATTLTHDGKMLYKYGYLYLFMINCGIREGEACALLKSDFDFDKKTLTVNKNINVVKKDDKTAEKGYIYAVEIATPKNSNSVRIVPLNKEAIRYAKLVMADFPKGDKFIYTETGRYVRPEILIKQFQKILHRAGVVKMGLHALRHTFVSVLFENNIDIYTIASIIGDEVSTVQRTYLHLYKERKARAVNATNVVAAAQAFEGNQEKSHERQSYA